MFRSHLVASYLMKSCQKAIGRASFDYSAIITMFILLLVVAERLAKAQRWHISLKNLSCCRNLGIISLLICRRPFSPHLLSSS